MRRIGRVAAIAAGLLAPALAAGRVGAEPGSRAEAAMQAAHGIDARGGFALASTVSRHAARLHLWPLAALAGGADPPARPGPLSLAIEGEAIGAHRHTARLDGEAGPGGAGMREAWLLRGLVGYDLLPALRAAFGEAAAALPGAHLDLSAGWALARRDLTGDRPNGRIGCPMRARGCARSAPASAGRWGRAGSPRSASG